MVRRPRRAAGHLRAAHCSSRRLRHWPPSGGYDGKTSPPGADLWPPGRTLWDVPIVEVERFVATEFFIYARQAGDLDGDGGLDIVLAVAATSPPARPRVELRAISLHDGAPLWSYPVRFQDAGYSAFLVGDLDGDAKAEVVLKDRLADGAAGMEVTALDGRDGSARWTWRGGDHWDERRRVTCRSV